MTTDKLIYTTDELMQDHKYAAEHMVGRQRLHGGFMPDGSYQPPRALIREAAFDAWETALRAKGGQPLDASASLLAGQRMPSVKQQRLLLRNDLGMTFWNGLTITGKIEAKGRILAEMTFPDLQPAIVEDITQMAIGHLNKGLLVAHGLDEGGEPDKDIGGHDAMWFVARNLVFGEDAFPDVEPPERISRPEEGTRFVPEIEPAIEALVSFIANLLIIEFRAEVGFADTQEVLRTDGIFPGCDTELAAELVERIRTDELIHVRSLCLYLGELASVTFKTVDGATIPGHEVIDRFWGGLVRWATVEQPKIAAVGRRAEIVDRIAAHAQGTALIAEFDSLAYAAA